ncbi:MAG: hypothetical protein ACUVRJ_10940 [Candidatus Villigracilaceae bacterium]
MIPVVLHPKSEYTISMNNPPKTEKRIQQLEKLVEVSPTLNSTQNINELLQSSSRPLSRFYSAKRL